MKIHLKRTGLSEEEITKHENAKICYICEDADRPFGNHDINSRKIHEHCHLSGLYRRESHSDCNMKYQTCRTVPVIFHNMMKYDGHFLIKEVAENFDSKINAIALSKENYISFTVNAEKVNYQTKNYHKIVKFKFIDSLRFMPSSLDKLAKNLKEHDIIRELFSNYDEERFVKC